VTHAPVEAQYLHILFELAYQGGEPQAERTGTGTWRAFGRRLSHDLAHGFPLLTTKRVWWKGVLAELLWFLSGSTNTTALVEQGVHIWDAWADDFGALGPVYGSQWRSWGGRGHDQVRALVDTLRADPSSRRAVVSAWNVEDLPFMALPPCHVMWQCVVERDGRVSMAVTQRSADVFLGLPFNLASYAALTHLIARSLGREPGWLHVALGDIHLYANHAEQARIQLERRARPLPTLELADRVRDVDDARLEDFIVRGYDPHPSLRGEVAV
jgi:thymidylate synthase